MAYELTYIPMSLVLRNVKTMNGTRATVEYMMTKRCRESISHRPSFDHLQGEPHQRRIVLFVADTHRPPPDDRRDASGYAAHRRTEPPLEDRRLRHQTWLGYLHARNPTPPPPHRT